MDTQGLIRNSLGAYLPHATPVMESVQHNSLSRYQRITHSLCASLMYERHIVKSQCFHTDRYRPISAGTGGKYKRNGQHTKKLAYAGISGTYNYKTPLQLYGEIIGDS